MRSDGKKNMRGDSKKYACIGGHVVSQNDGERHYISSKKLPDLYGVPAIECVFYEEDDLLYIPYQKIVDTELRILQPRSDGDYRLDNEKI